MATSNRIPGIESYRVLKEWELQTPVMTYEECYAYVLEKSGTTFTRATSEEMGMGWQISPIGTEIYPGAILTMKEPHYGREYDVRVIENSDRNAGVRVVNVDPKTKANWHEDREYDTGLRHVIAVKSYGEPPKD